MLVVVVDSATPAITAAVAEVTADRARLRAASVTVDPRAHGELLAPAIAAVLDEIDATPADLGAVVAGVGPGPFTGLRVGLVTAVALGQARGIPTYGVCSLDAIGAATDGRVLVATDARRREIYWAVYDDGKRITDPAVGRPAEVIDRITVDRAVGEGALRYADVLGVPVDPEPRYPAPAVLVALAADRIVTGAPGEPLVPLYLRRPDAAVPGAPKPVLA